ncbi:MAG: translation elongation factor-like protein [Acidimicrobiia bacterium]
MGEKKVGSVSHYYGAIGVAGISVTAELNVGDTIHVIGHTSDFTQTIDSMQVDHEQVESAGAGDQIGIKVVDRTRIHDEVFRVTDD